MSTDYFLYSPKANKAAMVGSVGLSGIKVWPTEYGGHALIRWAIESGGAEVRLVSEHDLPETAEFWRDPNSPPEA